MRIPAHIADRVHAGDGPIRAWREQAGISLSSLARRTCLDVARLLDVETERSLPSDDELHRIAIALGALREHLTVPQDDADGIGKSSLTVNGDRHKMLKRNA
jgi:transcriptional regulator with XRE-family HTH domain